MWRSPNADKEGSRRAGMKFPSLNGGGTFKWIVQEYIDPVTSRRVVFLYWDLDVDASFGYKSKHFLKIRLKSSFLSTTILFQYMSHVEIRNAYYYTSGSNIEALID